MDYLWAFPSPEAEARACLKLFEHTRDLDAVRRLISISETEKSELLALAKEQPLLADQIFVAIAFRQRVLVAFDKLLEREAEKERAA